MKSLWKLVSFLGALVVLGFIFMAGSSLITMLRGGEEGSYPSKPSILALDLSGVIIDGKKFLRDLRKYREMDAIKGVLIRIDSPGGVVGPSQEIYQEIKKVREEFKKPVVVSCNGLAASGAFYSAMAADKIVTNPGTLMGSIGVIMEFANLEKLYEWAKIKRYVVKTGAFKDTGAEYREMREDERLYLQGTMMEVLGQFKEAVAKGRNMPLEKVTAVADGRVFTGETAVKMGFADKVGTYSDALKLVGQMAKLGSRPEVFEPPKPHSILELVNGANAEEESETELKQFGQTLKRALGTELLGKPLFLMPGVWGAQ